jgi:hypothetical protein
MLVRKWLNKNAPNNFSLNSTQETHKDGNPLLHIRRGKIYD